MKFKEGLKIFVKKEPLYLWLVLFIVLINLMTLFASLGKKEALPEEPPVRVSKAQELFAKKEELKSAIIEDKDTSIMVGLAATGMALLILVGLFLDLVILIRKKGRKDLLERSHASIQINWSVWDALKVIILFLFFGHLILIIEALFIAPFFPSIKTSARIVSIANATIMDLVGVAVVFYFAIACYKHKIRDLGLTLKNFFKNILYGILGYISVVPILVAALLITVFFVNLFRYEPTTQPVLDMFLEEEKGGILTYLTIFVAVFGPIIEEIFFRGFLYKAIKKETKTGWAIFISAVLFSLLHVHLVGFLPILILGMFLAYLYEKTGSLVPSITVHVIHNLIMIFFIFLIKGIRF